jgi:hypothetical protein
MNEKREPAGRIRNVVYVFSPGGKVQSKASPGEVCAWVCFCVFSREKKEVRLER